MSGGRVRRWLYLDYIKLRVTFVAKRLQAGVSPGQNMGDAGVSASPSHLLCSFHPLLSLCLLPLSQSKGKQPLRVIIRICSTVTSQLLFVVILCASVALFCFLSQ